MSSIFGRKKAITALDEELQQQVVNRNCSHERNLKVEPSTVIIHAQTDEIYHLKGQKSASRVAFLVGKRLLQPCTTKKITVIQSL